MTHTRIFSRDFSLANIEVWYRAESINHKGWTENRQPISPYIIFEKVNEFVNAYYSDEGFAWTKGELLRKVKEHGFLLKLEKELLRKAEPMKEAYDKEMALNYYDFVMFLKNFEEAYPWFEAMWLLCDILDQLKGVDLAPLERIRKATEKMGPGTEQVIRNSLKKCFPKYKKYVHVISGDEIRSKKIPLIAELKKRDAGYFFTDNRLFAGVSKAFIEKKHDIKFREEKVSGNELKGTSAYPGIVFGTVKVVMGFREIGKVKKGDILVSSMTMIDVMPAIRRAAAIVTDEGGVLCHAAIAARELKKPCITGTKVATKVLKDGDLIEVDAGKGIVKVIK